MAEPMPESRLADIQAKIKRAWTELGEVCAEGPSKRFRMSIPSNLDRDSDLIVGSALEGAEDLAAEVDRLRQGMRDLYARWLQRAIDNGDYYNRTAEKYECGKAVAFDAAAEEIRSLIASPEVGGS